MRQERERKDSGTTDGECIIVYVLDKSHDLPLTPADTSSCCLCKRRSAKRVSSNHTTDDVQLSEEETLQNTHVISSNTYNEVDSIHHRGYAPCQTALDFNL